METSPLIEPAARRRWSARPPFRLLVLVGAWALFVVWWRAVLGSTSLETVFATAAVLGALVAAVAVIALVWIAHNLRIARRGRRGTPRRRELIYERDHLERETILPPPEVLLTARVVEVRIDDAWKVFAAERAVVEKVRV